MFFELIFKGPSPIAQKCDNNLTLGKILANERFGCAKFSGILRQRKRTQTNVTAELNFWFCVLYCYNSVANAKSLLSFNRSR